MSIDFSLKKVGKFAKCSIATYGTAIDLGFNDRDEAIKLLEEFKSAVFDLEWFINSTENSQNDTTKQ